MILYTVIPCYNEEPVLPETAKRLKEKYLRLIKSGLISEDSRIVFTDDGSRDKTWGIIERLHSSDKVFSGIPIKLITGLGFTILLVSIFMIIYYIFCWFSL